ncbi:SDR family NAD(P)-dependent oxidoreductase [Pseudonocardia alaniniphila]|uniref:SDR family NAD(P)-dependent oxidoreductase n=1 Tax=Pseudonocardia alaniniphila TaxID=75291 RepID=A0ABS9TQS0_9PSEU|nr:SDR family NAD(P)-dependent oxidoreductase [Pseudonocardia alaniniphila]MCH6170876.1 SDR family NAD(P)-dependent oxidoreductase [Pseudonocardia alaniniphila]
MTSAINQPPTRRTWLITGATSGIGRSLAIAALERGDNVAMLARNSGDQARELAQRRPDQVLIVETDVRDEQSVRAAVERTVERYGRIDVVANNAGFGLFGAVEEATDAEARAVFDTNVFGVLNVLRSTLPVLREQHSGHILQSSSYLGQTAFAGVGLLAATKYAVEGIADALVDEVAPFGIKVTLVQPGLTATAFLANIDVAEPNPAYDHTVRKVQTSIGTLPPEAFNAPDRVVTAIMAAVDSDRPPLRLATGSTAAQDMQAALEFRLSELDSWREITDNVDTPTH